jgi:RNA polymerase sigma factor (sigma-70 family)
LIEDTNVREYLAQSCWESLSNIVNSVLRAGGSMTGSHIRQTDKWKDCFSEACLGFVKGLNSYPTDNPNNTASYSSWCLTCAKNQVRNWLGRTNRWEMNEMQLSVFNTDDEDGEPLTWEDTFSDYNPTAEAQLIRKQRIVQAKKQVAKIKRKCSKLERKLITQYILSHNPKTQRDLAEGFNMSLGKINNLIQALKIRLRLEI